MFVQWIKTNAFLWRPICYGTILTRVLLLLSWAACSLIISWALTFFDSVWKNSRITQDTYKIWTQWRQVCGSSGFVQGTGVSTWPLAAEIWRHSRTGVTLQGAWAVIGSSSLKKTDYAQLNHILRKNCLEVGNITDKGWGMSIYQSRLYSQLTKEKIQEPSVYATVPGATKENFSVALCNSRRLEISSSQWHNPGL